jgi:hypothetical protein
LTTPARHGVGLDIHRYGIAVLGGVGPGPAGPDHPVRRDQDGRQKALALNVDTLAELAAPAIVKRLPTNSMFRKKQESRPSTSRKLSRRAPAETTWQSIMGGMSTMVSRMTDAGAKMSAIEYLRIDRIGRLIT